MKIPQLDPLEIEDVIQAADNRTGRRAPMWRESLPFEPVCRFP
jgi:hypothetical protein